MTRPSKLHALAMAAALCIGASPVMAADFGITVPVQVTNVPANTIIAVLCDVYDVGGVWGGAGVTVFIEIPDAGFNETVTVEVDVLEGFNPDNATSFDCSLRLGSVRSEDTDGVYTWEHCESIGLVPQDHPFQCGARGAVVIGKVFGEF